MDREVWRAAIHGVTKSQTQLTRLSSSSSFSITILCGLGDDTAIPPSNLNCSLAMSRPISLEATS